MEVESGLSEEIKNKMFATSQEYEFTTYILIVMIDSPRRERRESLPIHLLVLRILRHTKLYFLLLFIQQLHLE
jgi:hypothetical protein